MGTAQKIASAESMPPRLDKASDSERLQVVASEKLVARLEEWRAKQRPIPTRSEAIRVILETYLDEFEAREAAK